MPILSNDPSCLFGYVGVKHCPLPAPTSGLYINHLPGVSLHSINALADSEQQSFVGVWAAVQQAAWHRLVADALDVLGERGQLHRRLDAHDGPLPLAAPVPQTAPAGWWGVVLRCPPDRYAALQWQDVTLHLAAPAPAARIALFELATGRIVWEATLDLPAGESTLPIGIHTALELTEPAYFLAVTDVGDLHPFAASATSLPCRQSSSYACETSVATGPAGEAMPRYLLSAQPQGMLPLWVRWHYSCQAEAFVCANRDQLVHAWLFLLGAQLMRERMESPRLNAYTTLGRERAAELQSDYELAYQKALRNAVLNLPEPMTPCLRCPKPVASYRFASP
jgi:hypothetical protein